MKAWWPILLVLLATSVAMTLAWNWQRRRRNAGIVDAVWAYALAAAALIYAATGSGAVIPRLLVGAFAATWAVRLGTHLWRRVHREPEDGRYRHLREHWRDSQSRFFGFFQAQAILVVLFSLPFYVAAQNPTALPNPWMALAVAVWTISLVGESLADRQLRQFREIPNNRGKTCRVGLWRYSRHPNYFFEWTHWFSYALLSIGAPYAWIAWLGPLLMLISLCWVTGIPFVEAQALRSRGDDYRDYQRTTSAFVPWFPGYGNGESGVGNR